MHANQPAQNPLEAQLQAFWLQPKRFRGAAQAPGPKGEKKNNREEEKACGVYVCVITALQRCVTGWRRGQHDSDILEGPNQNTTAKDMICKQYAPTLAYKLSAGGEPSGTRAHSRTRTPYLNLPAPSHASYAVPHTCTQHIIRLSVKRTLDS